MPREARGIQESLFQRKTVSICTAKFTDNNSCSGTKRIVLENIEITGAENYTCTIHKQQGNGARKKLRCPAFLCNSKNKPPALQGEGISLDKRINSCVMIEVGLQNHK